MFAQASLLALAVHAGAQVKLGEVTSSASGTISTGYSADFGNVISSDHNWLLGGVANYAGSFHNPNFLSFNASVYINQSRANSDFQSISNASGVNLGANIFSGSRYPGALSFTKAYNSEGSYAVPGIGNYVTHGNNDAFAINWGETIPGVPSFNAGYQLGNSKYSVYGTNDQGSDKFHTLNLHSSYRLAGFNLGAYYTKGASDALIPEVVSGSADAESQSDNDAFGLTVSHRLPLQGSASASLSRSQWNDDYEGTTSNGTIDFINTNAMVHPSPKVTFSASANYSDNLAGQLIESVINAGGAGAALPITSQTSNSLDLLGLMSYVPAPNFQTSVFVEHRIQLFLGEKYGEYSLGGSAGYSHRLYDGSLNATMTISENIDQQTGQDSLGLSTTENYSGNMLGWHVTGMFGYAQNVQTLLVTYMNSSFNYSGNIRRHWGLFNLSMGAGASRTALTQQAGDASSNQSYYASMGYGKFVTANGSYSKASGQALATGAGLVPIPIPSPILPASLVSLYGGDSYSFALSSSPIRNLILSASYSKSLSNTSNSGATSSNETDQYNALVQYRVRKLNFDSGYARLGQGFSGSGTGPEVVSSFYIGVMRWFNLF
jgi:hypothetical protein